jgi:hypothetical protein
LFLQELPVAGGTVPLGAIPDSLALADFFKAPKDELLNVRQPRGQDVEVAGGVSNLAVFPATAVDNVRPLVLVP